MRYKNTDAVPIKEEGATKMPNELKLLPCPFCGGNAFISARLPYFGEVLTVAVVCEECNASSKHKRTEEEVVAAWNRRENDE